MATTQQAIDELFGAQRRVATDGSAENAAQSIAAQNMQRIPSLRGVSFADMIGQLRRQSLLDNRQKEKLRVLANEFTEDAFVARAIAICNEPPNGWDDTDEMVRVRRHRGPEGRSLVEDTIARMLPAPYVGDGYDGLRNA
jgi:hypothetical protein